MNRTYKVAKPFDPPSGFVDAMSDGEASIRWQPKAVPPSGRSLKEVEIVSEVAGRSGLSTADAAKAYKAVLAVITDHLRDDGLVELTDFGTFVVTPDANTEGEGAAMPANAPAVVEFMPGIQVREAIDERDPA